MQLGLPTSSHTVAAWSAKPRHANYKISVSMLPPTPSPHLLSFPSLHSVRSSAPASTTLAVTLSAGLLSKPMADEPASLGPVPSCIHSFICLFVHSFILKSVNLSLNTLLFLLKLQQEPHPLPLLPNTCLLFSQAGELLVSACRGRIRIRVLC